MKVVVVKRSKFVWLVLCIALVFNSVLAQNTETSDETIGENNIDKETPSVESSSNTLSNQHKVQQAINTSPMSLISGTVTAIYELCLAQKYGICLEGSYTFPSKTRGYALGLSYRHHFITKKRHSGINSPFWGVYARYTSLKGVGVDMDNSSTEYPYTVEGVSAGANIGRRWVIGKAFTITGRIGAGYPGETFKWKDGKPEESYELYETLIKVVSAIDGELSIGFVF